MEKEQVNLSISREDLELIFYSVEARRALGRRTLDYHQGGENVMEEIEECKDVAEAEYVVSVYDALYLKLQARMASVGVN